MSQVKVAYTFYGDATMNGTANIEDMGKVLANYNQVLPPDLSITP